MAICYWDAKMLWEARLRGVSFAKTATIGHLSLYLHSAELAYFRQSYRSKFPQSVMEPLGNYSFGDYSDDFLEGYLGVTEKTIIDASAYEGADTVHDLNLPIPDALIGAFDAVIDNGSLEHVFNFPTAISNLMKMVNVGGSIFISTPANNLCGHGFFQFSPELMFRVFAEENGFALNQVVVTEGVFPSVEMSPHRAAYAVTDPENIHSRVGLLSKGSVMMIVEAVKLENVRLFEIYPMQSDYVALWNSGAMGSTATSNWKQRLKPIFRRLPLSAQLFLTGHRQKRMFSFANKKFYRRIK
jgi:hypothetical protein